MVASNQMSASERDVMNYDSSLLSYHYHHYYTKSTTVDNDRAGTHFCTRQHNWFCWWRNALRNVKCHIWTAYILSYKWWELYFFRCELGVCATYEVKYTDQVIKHLCNLMKVYPSICVYGEVLDIVPNKRLFLKIIFAVH